jgi:hypothetical protein
VNLDGDEDKDINVNVNVGIDMDVDEEVNVKKYRGVGEMDLVEEGIVFSLKPLFIIRRRSVESVIFKCYDKM